MTPLETRAPGRGRPVRTISCDACERTDRCVRIETGRGHQIDLCRSCLREATAAIDARGTECPVRGDDRQRALVALSFGPLTRRELVEEVYPVPTTDPDEAMLRVGRVRGMLHRLVARGLVERVGHGVYALVGSGPRVEHAASIESCRRLLVRTPGGLTTRQIAARLDAPASTVHTWLRRLREGGAPIAVVQVGRRGTAGCWCHRWEAASAQSVSEAAE